MDDDHYIRIYEYRYPIFKLTMFSLQYLLDLHGIYLFTLRPPSTRNRPWRSKDANQ